MRSREITLWTDERWYKALTEHLQNETVEKKLEGYLDSLIQQLPAEARQRISSEIEEEDRHLQQELEAARKFAVLHVTEGAREIYLQTERPMEFLELAQRISLYTHGKCKGNCFAESLYHTQHISAEQFQKMAALRMENTGKVTGAFELDFDNMTLSALHIMDGWKSFAIQDVTTASYFANKAKYISTEKRWEIFLNRLDGKELNASPPDIFLEGKRPLTVDDVSFSEEVIQDDNALEFYLETAFDPAEVFGNAVNTAETDGYVNIYARYDMETGSVMDTLDVYLVGGDGHELGFKYKLSPEEQEILLPAMESYCVQRMGMGLDACRQQYLDEGGEQAPQDGQIGPQTGQTM